MSIEELTKRRNEYCEYTHPADWEAGIQNFMNEVINTFKSQLEEITKLRGKVKKLEQAKTYFPFTKKEVKKIKLGGTDPE